MITPSKRLACLVVHEEVLERLDHRVVAERGLPVHPLPNTIHEKSGLKGQRILRPEGAVVVEDGDPLGRCDMIRRGRIAHPADEVDDGTLGGTVVPGRQ